MKIVVAPDSFKGSLSAIEAAKAMLEGIHEVDKMIETVLLPAADGGEGTMESLVGATNGKVVLVGTQDPLGRSIEAGYGVLGDGNTCVIELAEASGLTLLSQEEKNPLHTTTYGTGELIRHALNEGYRKFIVGLGGSATNDGGMGLLQALGARFLDGNGLELQPGGGSLIHLNRIDLTSFDERINESEFTIACDVNNPLVGPNGASHIFGPQKGASFEVAEKLDQSLTRFADVVEDQFGVSLHNSIGAGAAGGVGGAFEAFFPGEMKQGIEVVLEAIQFENHLERADLIITGEGKSDRQTLSGKTPLGIAKAAKKREVPVILISGVIDKEFEEMLSPYFKELHELADQNVTTENAIRHAAHYLKVKTKRVIEDYVK